MILRLSQKLNTKIKAGKLTEMPLDENPYPKEVFKGLVESLDTE